MGARASVSFKKGQDESVTLFSHWGGDAFHDTAVLYAKGLVQDIQNGTLSRGWPLSRLEPDTVMVDFIRETTKDQAHVTNDLYLGKDEEDGDNGDYGHKTVLLDELGAALN